MREVTQAYKQTNKRTTMAKKENKFIVIAHDLQTLAAMLCKNQMSSSPSEAITFLKQS